MWNPQHLREIHRKTIAKQTGATLFFSKLTSKAADIMSTPKWTEIMKSFDDKAKVFLRKSGTRFRQHVSKSISRCLENYGVAHKVHKLQLAEPTVKNQPIHYIWPTTMYLGSLMLYKDVLNVTDSMNYLNQQTQVVWPGVFHWSKIQEFKGLTKIISELDAFSEIVTQHYISGDINVRERINNLGDINCKTFGEGLCHILQGTYDGVELVDENWFEVYNKRRTTNKSWDPASHYFIDDEESDSDVEYEDEEWEPTELKRQQLNDDASDGWREESEELKPNVDPDATPINKCNAHVKKYCLKFRKLACDDACPQLCPGQVSNSDEMPSPSVTPEIIGDQSSSTQSSNEDDTKPDWILNQIEGRDYNKFDDHPFICLCVQRFIDTMLAKGCDEGVEELLKVQGTKGEFVPLWNLYSKLKKCNG